MLNDHRIDVSVDEREIAFHCLSLSDYSLLVKRKTDTSRDICMHTYRQSRGTNKTKRRESVALILSVEFALLAEGFESETEIGIGIIIIIIDDFIRVHSCR